MNGPGARGAAAARPVAIVTGASGGIGKATSRALRKSGFVVVGTSRGGNTPAALNGRGLAQVDITDDLSVQRLTDDVLARFGRIDVLINNAGAGFAGAAEELTLAQTRTAFDINVLGAIRMTNAVLPHMRRARHGRIVNVSSVLGILPAPFMAVYAATKFSIEGYSQSLDHETRDFGVRVTVVAPAYTNTDFESNVQWGEAPLVEYDAQRQRTRSMLAQAMRNADSPDVVADTILAAATAAVPQPRYSAGRTSKSATILRRLAPAWIVDAQIRKLNGLSR